MTLRTDNDLKSKNFSWKKVYILIQKENLIQKDNLRSKPIEKDKTFGLKKTYFFGSP